MSDLKKTMLITASILSVNPPKMILKKKSFTTFACSTFLESES